MTYKLEDFYEAMQHEIASCSMVLSACGYKLDGEDGIKTKLRIFDSGGNTPKSCDYIQLFENKLFFIEFSDLKKQHDNLNHVYSCIGKLSDELSRSQYKHTSKLLRASTQIQQEIHEKISDTDFILREIVNNNLIFPFIDLSKEKSILVVWHQETKEMDIDFAKVLDDLRGKIISKISKLNLEYLKVHLYFLTMDAYKSRYDQ